MTLGVTAGIILARETPEAYLLDNTPAPGVSPTISQTVNGLNPGSEYIISGSYVWSLGLGDTFSANTPSFGVAMNGDLLFEATAQQDELNWQDFQFLVYRHVSEYSFKPFFPDKWNAGFL